MKVKVRKQISSCDLHEYDGKLPMELLCKVAVRIIYKTVRAWKAIRLKHSSKKKKNYQKPTMSILETKLLKY